MRQSLRWDLEMRQNEKKETVEMKKMNKGNSKGFLFSCF